MELLKGKLMDVFSYKFDIDILHISSNTKLTSNKTRNISGHMMTVTLVEFSPTINTKRVRKEVSFQ